MMFSDLMHCMTFYLDDKLVFGPSIEQHLLDLHVVFEKLGSDKCCFGKMLMKYLGHIIEAGSLRVDPGKVEAIRMWPKPTTVKEL